MSGRKRSTHLDQMIGAGGMISSRGVDWASEGQPGRAHDPVDPLDLVAEVPAEPDHLSKLVDVDRVDEQPS